MTEKELVEIVVLSNNFHFRGELICKNDLEITIVDDKTNKRMTFPRSGVIIVGGNNESRDN